MKIKLKNVRLAFPDLFVPTAFTEGQEKKYGATFLLPKDHPDVKVVEDAIMKVATETWGDDAENIVSSIRGNNQKFCFIDGDTKSLDGYAGCMALSAKSAKRPLVIDRDKTPLTADDPIPYAGCYVYGSIEIWAQNNQWGKGIRASLAGVQYYRDGDAFTAGAVASPDEFDDLSEGSDDVDDLC